jgi:hypothetical protein
LEYNTREWLFTPLALQQQQQQQHHPSASVLMSGAAHTLEDRIPYAAVKTRLSARSVTASAGHTSKRIERNDKYLVNQLLKYIAEFFLVSGE